MAMRARVAWCAREARRPTFWFPPEADSMRLSLDARRKGEARLVAARPGARPQKSFGWEGRAQEKTGRTRSGDRLVDVASTTISKEGFVLCLKRQLYVSYLQP